MAEHIRGDGNKKKKKGPKSSGQGDTPNSHGKTPNSRGNTFYEAISATAVVPKAIHLPKIGVKTADFLESIVIFFAGTVEALLLVRVMMMMFGANGGNLLTYLLYATSYPFVLALNSGQQQIPSLANNLIAENVALMVMYLVLSYLLFAVVKAFKDDEKEIN